MAEKIQNRAGGDFDFYAFFKNFRHVLRRGFLLLPILAVLVSGIFVFRAYRSYSPVYASKAVLSVSSGYSSTTDILSYSNYYDTAAAKQIVTTFPVIVDTDAMQELIMQELGASYVNGVITPSIVADSNLFTLTVRSSDPEAAYAILNAVIKNYPRIAAETIGSAQITLIEEPTVPTEPVNQLSLLTPGRNGFLIGLAAALAVLLLISLGRKTVLSSDDVKGFSSLPCMGQIPLALLKKRKTRQAPSLSVLNPAIPAGYLEAIRTVRTRLVHQNREHKCKVIMVTSTLGSEGKTTLAANLALTLAESQFKVILVDADLRIQSLYRFFNLSGAAVGLGKLLEGQEPEAIPALQNVEGSSLRLLAGREGQASPYRLLRGRNLSRIFSQLREEADFVIVDTPPCGILSDSSSFLQYVDGVIYVIKQDYANRTQIMNSLRSLEEGDALVLGYVLNGMPRSGSRYGYGYGKYGYGKYGYGYGYGSYDKYGYGKSEKKASAKKEEA